jgi:hypothetical protein
MQPYPPENVTCLTRLDHNRALGQVSQRTGVPAGAYTIPLFGLT